MKRSMLIVISIVTVLGILLAAASLGFADSRKNSSSNAAFTEKQPAKTVEEAITDAQEKVSFNILRPSYVPQGYELSTANISAARFRGVSTELEQAMLRYTNGNEILNLKEFRIINKTEKSPEIPVDTREIVDINGIEGRFRMEPDGSKYLNWKVGELSLTISSLVYESNNITGSLLEKDEMIKMARSVK